MTFSCVIYLVAIKLIKESAINWFLLVLSAKQEITMQKYIYIYILTFVSTVPEYQL